MTHLFSLLPAGGWQRLVCDALWQSTFIGACGWLAARYLVRQSAARAWLLLVALSACGLVPLASVAARQMQWTVFTGQPTIASKLPALPTAAPVISNDEALPGIVNRTINPQE
ncbi:MAG TPA: hypothetical protein VMJ32_15895, partial [Pirellulales bacterium]|nr:hypothetical protein [Pirellulales bacterium]